MFEYAVSSGKGILLAYGTTSNIQWIRETAIDKGITVLLGRAPRDCETGS